MNKRQARLIVGIALLAVVAVLGTAVAAANSPDEGRNLADVRAATAPLELPGEPRGGDDVQPARRAGLRTRSSSCG